MPDTIAAWVLVAPAISTSRGTKTSPCLTYTIVLPPDPLSASRGTISPPAASVVATSALAERSGMTRGSTVSRATRTATLRTLKLTRRPPRASAPTACTRPLTTGIWQGTLHAPNGQGLRIVYKISKTATGWSAQSYSLDQTPVPFPVTLITLQGADVKINVQRDRKTGA